MGLGLYCCLTLILKYVTYLVLIIKLLIVCLEIVHVTVTDKSLHEGEVPILFKNKRKGQVMTVEKDIIVEVIKMAYRIPNS